MRKLEGKVTVITGATSGMALAASGPPACQHLVTGMKPGAGRSRPAWGSPARHIGDQVEIPVH